MELSRRISSKEFFTRQRYQVLIEMTIEYLNFDDKLKLMNINQKMKKLIIDKTKFIKVRRNFLTFSFGNLSKKNFKII